MDTEGSTGHTNLIVNQFDNEVIENIQPVKDKKRKKKKKDTSGAVNLDKELEMNTHCASTNGRQKFRDRGNKKRKEKSRGCYTEVDATDCMPEMNKAAEPSELSTHKKSKKVQFSETVEVFPLSDESIKEKKKMVEVGNEENNNVENGLVQGKRFSKEEDEMVRNAVYKYVEDHQLGEEGVEMVMNCRLHQELKGCWKEIGESLPWRPYLAVYSRAHVLFERSEDRKWTPEEVELVKKFYEKHGPDWKTLGDELGKHRFHVKDVWRRTRYPNLKKGTWSQEEYQNLFNLVNMDLSMKVFTEKRSKHGMLRDNIAWDAVSDQLATRSNSLCCMKWYDSLTSPMVAEGKWANSDDYRMLIALVDRDDACEDDVDWDNLLEHRSGDICRKRWNQMVRHIGEHGRKSFIEQVEILSQRYCPNILEARESYDNRPAVDA
ncbi:cyclin-D-binding Myb-like transcription factor 1 [Chenopodium quinoa]|uniref:cyclin-D-binding Myb-like transcription factor 1 n=1 Tax=Chenopodium quinoa TaxID=63459 RepID=UPI000B78178D|nr:cyclin-D-binding Myb-like transcription factor 1 [Chenopodium quinoa]XP_021763943.1 cyclin-D-binding Myb-like transcription factor 1 [Chenopodium quinoa]